MASWQRRPSKPANSCARRRLTHMQDLMAESWPEVARAPQASLDQFLSSCSANYFKVPYSPHLPPTSFTRASLKMLKTLCPAHCTVCQSQLLDAGPSAPKPRENPFRACA